MSNAAMKRALQLCEWIAETPHQRGSINGLAAQLRYELQQEMSKALPEPCTDVLAWDGHQWVRAQWVPIHTKEQHGDSDFYDYDEAGDIYYWPEGWYEMQTHGGDEMCWHITDGVTAWRPMPPAPQQKGTA